MQGLNQGRGQSVDQILLLIRPKSGGGGDKCPNYPPWFRRSCFATIIHGSLSGGGCRALDGWVDGSLVFVKAASNYYGEK
jgi:hypothetical protein